MFNLINGRLPYTDEHLFVPEGETPSGIIGEKLSLKELFAKCFRTGSNDLVSSLFLAALLMFFIGKEVLPKNFLTVEVLSSDNSRNLKFDALTDLCIEIGARLENTIFGNLERERLDMEKQTEEISKNYDFFDDKDDKKMLK